MSTFWYEKILIEILKCGPIPKHIAFCMDGNRRYSKKHGIDKKQGNNRGYNKAKQVLRYCQLLGVEELTYFAFSVDNFNRTEEDVNHIMNLVLDKITDLMEFFFELNVRFQFFGNLEMIPKNVLESLKGLARATRNNTKTTVNVAFAYSSRHEIMNSLKIIHAGVRNGQILLDDVDEDLIGATLMIKNKVDVWIRTSECRLSDFLLWQISTADVFFCQVYWPSFSFLNVLWFLLTYQKNYFCKEKHSSSTKCTDGRVEAFVEKTDEQKLSVILN